MWLKMQRTYLIPKRVIITIASFYVLSSSKGGPYAAHAGY